MHQGFTITTIRSTENDSIVISAKALKTNINDKTMKKGGI